MCCKYVAELPAKHGLVPELGKAVLAMEKQFRCKSVHLIVAGGTHDECVCEPVLAQDQDGTFHCWQGQHCYAGFDRELK